VQANVSVLLGLVMMRPRCAGDGVAELMMVVACLGAAADRQFVAVDRSGDANDRHGATTIVWVLLVTVRVPLSIVWMPSSTIRVLPSTIRVPL
jgi:hypothetical protein